MTWRRRSSATSSSSASSCSRSPAGGPGTTQQPPWRLRSMRRWSSPARTGRRRGSGRTRLAPLLVSALRDAGFDVAPDVLVVPDDEIEIATLLARLADGGHRLILTTGGTGLTPSDVTPAATRRVHRARSARPGRAHACRRHGLDPDGRPLARRRGDARGGAHRELARIAKGRDRVARGTLAGAAARLGPARGRRPLKAGDAGRSRRCQRIYH